MAELLFSPSVQYMLAFFALKTQKPTKECLASPDYSLNRQWIF